MRRKNKKLFKKLKNFNNLSIDDVNYPNPNDWTSWRRSPLSHGFTPLNQINKKIP